MTKLCPEHALLYNIYETGQVTLTANASKNIWEKYNTLESDGFVIRYGSTFYITPYVENLISELGY